MVILMLNFDVSVYQSNLALRFINFNGRNRFDENLTLSYYWGTNLRFKIYKRPKLDIWNRLWAP